jgi:hypothetical protein
MPRKRTLERKLFGWLLVLAVVPALLVLALAFGIGSRARSVNPVRRLSPRSSDRRRPVQSTVHRPGTGLS